MGKFDIKRFWRTLKWFFYERRGLLLKWMLSVMLATIVLESFFTSIMSKSQHVDIEGISPYQAAVLSASSMCLVIVFIGVILANCNIFGLLDTKQKRIAFLTLPATNLERWLTALLFAVIIMPACIVLGYMAGDVLRNCYFHLMGHEWRSGLSIFTGNENSNTIGYLLGCSTTLWACSLYVLGGTWFRKGQFIIVTLVQIAISTLLIFLAHVFHDQITTMLVNGFTSGHAPALAYALIAVITVVALFNFWLSYQIFKRFQIITSKWINV